MMADIKALKLNGLREMFARQLHDAEARRQQAVDDARKWTAALEMLASIEEAGGFTWDAESHSYVPRPTGTEAPLMGAARIERLEKP